MMLNGIQHPTVVHKFLCCKIQAHLENKQEWDAEKSKKNIFESKDMQKVTLK